LLHWVLLISISMVSISIVSIREINVRIKVFRSACLEMNTSFKTAYTSITLVGALASSLISRLLEGSMSSELSNYTRRQFCSE
jgi:hypothetical protein